jgi:hypothetical protein
MEQYVMCQKPVMGFQQHALRMPQNPIAPPHALLQAFRAVSTQPQVQPMNEAESKTAH